MAKRQNRRGNLGTEHSDGPGAEPSNFTHGSGATSSHLTPEIDQIHELFIHRLGLRYSLGTIKHGRGNYLRAFTFKPNGDIATVDIPFLRDRYRHAMEHLAALRHGTKTDDHIGAVGWFLSFASMVESFGIDWAEVVKIRTPEDDKQYLERMGCLPNKGDR